MTNHWRAINRSILVAVAVLIVAVCARWDPQYWGSDSRAYWAVDLADPYVSQVGGHGAYLYSPSFAQIVAVVAHLVPREVFLALWTFGAVAALGWLGGRWAAPLLLFPPVILEAWYGNIHLLLATAIVLGFRWPVAWAFVLLTKVTPGVGLVWFAARREWRQLGIALGATAAIVGVSFLFAPHLWTAWIALLMNEAGRPPMQAPGVIFLGPLWLRLMVAAAIAALGGLFGYRWPVIVAATIAMPVIWVHTPAMLVALVPLLIADRRYPLPRVRLEIPGVLVRRQPPAS